MAHLKTTTVHQSAYQQCSKWADCYSISLFLSDVRSQNFQVGKLLPVAWNAVCLNYLVYPHQRKTGTKFNAFFVSTNELRSDEGPIKESKSSEHIQKHGPDVG